MAARKPTAKSPTHKTCEEITDLVFDYLDGTLGAGVKRDFQQHLRLCPDCEAFLNTYRKTVTMTRSLRVEDMPATVRNSIADFLRKRALRS